jgi:hypothetical protein
MVLYTISRGITFLALAAFAINAVAGHQGYLKTHIHFLATSTSFRSSLARGQDVYLVELTARAGGEPVLARLIDEYPAYRAPLSLETLTTATGAIPKVRRDTTCDIAFGALPLRTEPGDPMAILPERLGFQPHLSLPVLSNHEVRNRAKYIRFTKLRYQKFQFQ